MSQTLTPRRSAQMRARFRAALRLTIFPTAGQALWDGYDQRPRESGVSMALRTTEWGKSVGSNILVVEDQTLIGLDIRYTLSELGYDVPVVVTTGKEAIEEVARHPPHLVLMDIGLKGPLDGVETAPRLQEEHDIPVVSLTSHSDATTLAGAKETGPYGYVVKPFHEGELRASIE